MTYKYHLSTQTIVCPSCGKRRFKPYVDEAGQILDPEVGRCNRQFNCGYHYPPRDFFRDNPLKRVSAIGDNRARSRFGIAARRPPHPQQVRPLDFISSATVLRTLPGALSNPDGSPNHLRRWLAQQFPPQLVHEVATLYCLGDSTRLGGGAIFWYIDPQRRVRSGKIMAYDPQGHRVKTDTNANVLFVHKLISPDFNYSLCYFGVHLLPKNPDAKVIIVESEKTAIYLALWLAQRGAFPQRYIPVATGGCSRFVIHPEMIGSSSLPGYHGNDIRNRHVIAIPDADQVDAWRSSSTTWRQQNLSFRLLDIRRYTSSPSADIADLLQARVGN